MKSHSELSGEAALRILESIDDELVVKIAATERALEKFGKPSEDPGELNVCGVSPAGLRHIEACAKAWRLSRSGAVRFLVADGLARYGFDSAGILATKDFRAMRRAPDVNGPLQNRSVALKLARARWGSDVIDLD